MSLENEFNTYAEKVKTMIYKPTNTELGELYGLYKQATVGNNNTTRPGFLDLKGRAKWDSWESKKNLSNRDAMSQYVALVKTLLLK